MLTSTLEARKTQVGAMSTGSILLREYLQTSGDRDLRNLDEKSFGTKNCRSDYVIMKIILHCYKMGGTLMEPGQSSTEGYFILTSSNFITFMTSFLKLTT